MKSLSKVVSCYSGSLTVKVIPTNSWKLTLNVMEAIIKDLTHEAVYGIPTFFYDNERSIEIAEEEKKYMFGHERIRAL